MPELNYPTLTVRTEYPGAAPEEVENEISRPIEEALGVIGGLNKISSISRAGISDVVLEFVWGTNMDKAAQEALEKLELVFLPREAERPLLLHFDPALDPIMELSFSGKGQRYQGEQGLRRLRRIAELQIKRLLEPIKGVAAVRVRGGLQEEYHVLLSKEALQRSGLSIQNVIDRLRQENINVAGGTLKEGRAEYMVRTLNEYENLAEIAETVVTRIEDRNVRLKDLARVVRAHKEREIMTKTDGAESVEIDIYKEADANMVAVAKAVTVAVGAITSEPEGGDKKPDSGPSGLGRRNDGLAQRLYKEEGARLEVAADRSKFIESSINEVRDTAIYGGLLAIAVLYLFLIDVKTTLIISLTIPLSLLITFAPLNVLGTNEVKGAVIASTLTTVAVFFPIVFVEGIAGQAFGDLGWAVVISQIASLLVAIYFIPMLASRQKFQARQESGAAKPWTSFWSWRDFNEKRRATPKRLLSFVMPWLVVRLLAAIVLELIGKLLLLILGGILWL